MLNTLPQEILVGILLATSDRDVCSLKRTSSVNCATIDSVETGSYWKLRFEESIGCSILLSISNWKFSYIAYMYKDWPHTVDSICDAIVVSVTTLQHYSFTPACLLSLRTGDAVVEELSQNRVHTVLTLAKSLSDQFTSNDLLTDIVNRSIASWYHTNIELFYRYSHMFFNKRVLMWYVCDDIAYKGDICAMKNFLSEHPQFMDCDRSISSRVIEHLVAQESGYVMLGFCLQKGLINDEKQANVINIYIERGSLQILKTVISDVVITDSVLMYDSILKCSDRGCVEYAVTLLEDATELLYKAALLGNVVVVASILGLEHYEVEETMCDIVEKAHLDGNSDIARMILYHPSALQMHHLEEWDALVQLIPLGE